MPSIRNRITLAAGAVNPNVAVGSSFEFPRGPSRVQVALAQEAPGAGIGLVEAEIVFGSEVQLEQGRINTEEVAGGGPNVPRDVIADDVAMGGDRLRVALRNIDAANPVDVGYLIKITPMA